VKWLGGDLLENLKYQFFKKKDNGVEYKALTGGISALCQRHPVK